MAKYLRPLFLLAAAGISLFVPVSGIRAQTSQSTPPDLESEALSSGNSSLSAAGLWANHFSLFQGSSFASPSSYQPDLEGEPDINRPVAFRNFTTLGWQGPGGVGLAGTFAWAAQAGENSGLVMKDPSLRFYHSQLSSLDWLDWYSDVRFHIAAGPESQLQGRTLGVQNFNSITFQSDALPVWGGIWLSARWNHYRFQSNSPIWEFYIAPNIHWGVSPNLTFSLSLEENAGIWMDFTDSASYGSADPWYAEAAITWRLSPTLEIFPLFNFPLSNQTRIQSVAGGIGFSWNFL